MDVLPPDNVDDNMGAEHDSDIEEGGFGEPPPHLAARLNRNRANARRKSSAASSRRNSMSSVHSHPSSRSHYRASSTCQSNLVAQHLRRNSILESRRARLADRAAHVEQVRLRAALVKAAPRATTFNSEERAHAAQLAKEKYLAKVTAACAEEVARVKRVAEMVKERKLAAEARQRTEMEERHAEAEKRRAEYQRNMQERRARRSDAAERKLAVVEEAGATDSPLDEPAAAARIQRAWRRSQRGAVVHAFENLNLQLGSTEIETMTFAYLTDFIANPQNIAKTTALLTQLRLQDANDENETLNTRTFLSAFLITRHPEAVLNGKNGAHEQDVTQKATDMLDSLQATLVGLAPWNDYTPNATQLETLSQAYSSYTSAFAAWKLQDSTVLIEGMVASFVELDAIWQTVKDDSRGEVAAEYREGIRDYQVMILTRIRRIAGPERADTLIKKAIRESRRLRPRKRPTSEVRPRGVEAAAGVGTAANEDSDSAIDGALSQFADLQSGEITRKLFTPMPSNRVLNHELAIDKDYRLSDVSADLRDDLYRAICDAMKQGFEAGEGSAWTISAAENVREKLLRMLKPGNSMYTLIDEALDLQQVAQQCEAGVFSYEHFFGFMADMLPKLCAPYRDAEIAQVAVALRDEDNSLDGMIGKLFKLLRCVDKLSLDYSNFLLMSAAPTLTPEAASYEARQFAADLEFGRTTLIRTKRWYQTTRALLQREVDRRDPEVSSRGSLPNSVTHQQIYARGVVDLAVTQGHLSDEDIPETLTLDTDRLRNLRRQAGRIVVIGAILLTAKNLLKRDVRGQWKNESTRLWQLFSTTSFTTTSPEPSDDGMQELPLAQKAFAIIETAHNMPSATKTQLLSAVTRFCTQASTATSTGRFTDPVLKVLINRLRAHVLSRISAQTSIEKVRAAGTAAEQLTSYGLGEMAIQIGQMVELLGRIRLVDMQAHERWYEEILRDSDAVDEAASG